MRVLVSAELEAFLEDTEVPDDVEVEILDPEQDIPAGDYAGIIPTLTRPVGPAELDRLPALRVVANYAVGYDNIDVPAARDRGVGVSNTPGVLTGATAELTWTLILAACRRVPEGEALARSGRWDGWQPTQLLGMGLEGKTLGIVGAGRIGQEVAHRAPAFGMRVVYWDKDAAPALEANGAERLDLDALLADADIVSIHLPLNSETQGLIDRHALARMKPTAVLVNTARGPIVVEEALIEALEQRRLRAAGLDVYEHEPEIPERLRALPNTVLLPHLGSATEETRRAMWDTAWDNLLRGIRREPLANPVY